LAAEGVHLIGRRVHSKHRRLAVGFGSKGLKGEVLLAIGVRDDLDRPMHAAFRQHAAPLRTLACSRSVASDERQKADRRTRPVAAFRGEGRCGRAWPAVPAKAQLRPALESADAKKVFALLDLVLWQGIESAILENVPGKEEARVPSSRLTLARKIGLDAPLLCQLRAQDVG
jgi:hypothetical protein